MEDVEKSGLKNDLEIAQSNPTLVKKKERREKRRKNKIDASENCTIHNDGANLSPDVENGVQKNLESTHNNSELVGKRRKKKEKKLNDSENYNISSDFNESSVLVENVALKTDVDVENVQDDPIAGVNEKKNRRRRKHEVLVEDAGLKIGVDVENVQDDPIVEATKNKRKKSKSKHGVLDNNDSVRADVEKNPLLVENPSPLTRDVAVEATQNGKIIQEDNPHLKSNVNVENVLRKKKIKHNALEDSSSLFNDLQEDTLLVTNPSSQVENGLQKDLETMHNDPESGGKQKNKKKKKNVLMEHEVLVENVALKSDVDVKNVQDDPIIVAKKNKRKKMKSKHDNVLDDNSVRADVEENSLLMESPSPLKRDVAVEITQNGKSRREDNPTLKSNVNVESVHRKKKMKHSALEGSSSVRNDLEEDTLLVKNPSPQAENGVQKDLETMHNTPEPGGKQRKKKKKTNVLMELNEEKTPSLSNMAPIGNDAGLLINNRICPPEVVEVASPERSLSDVRKKLLILDVNGLLADIRLEATSDYKADFIVSGKKVFRRPFCQDFLRFCMEKFDVAVWSSRKISNVNAVLKSLVGKSTKNKLLFCWDQSYCTRTGFMTLENKDKPLVLKELRKVWDCSKDYNESNTLLLDDSPYKALRNPAHTAIFPRSYCYNDTKDCSLGPGGDLRVYLEEIAACENVQEYVKNNPFGQRPITETCISWVFYRQIALVDSNQQNASRN